MNDEVPYFDIQLFLVHLFNIPMDYPDQLQDIEDGLKIYVPVQKLIKPTYEYLLSQDPDTPFPFWAQVWPSARAMVSFLQDQPAMVSNKSVLELGAGIGIPSFCIAHLAGQIVISDHAKDAVKLIDKNIRHLGISNMRAACLDWNHLPDDIHADVLLLSDINYAPVQFETLLSLIRKFVERGTTLILSTPQRITSTAFADAVQSYIKKSVIIPVHHGGQVVDILVLVLSE